MGKYTRDSEELLKLVGGKENIAAVSHCMTRMRFVLADPKKADVKKIEAMKVVKGSFTQAGQFQVIIGNTVSEFYKDFTDVAGIEGVSKDAVKAAAGANQNPGETRMDLINKNSSIFKSIVNNVMQNDFKGIFLVATNPLDVMTYLTWKYSKIPSNQVIGSGTSLDTSRLKYLIGSRLNVNPSCVNAYVIGEHGDSEFVPWSKANVALEPIDKFLNKNDLDNICEEVRNAAYKIIDRKGATYYGIGMCLVRITNAILGDEKSVMVVSNYDKTNNVFVGLPCVLGRLGVINKIYFNLNDEETKKLQNSIDVIKEAINKKDFSAMNITDEDKRIYQNFTNAIYDDINCYYEQPIFINDSQQLIKCLEDLLEENLFEDEIYCNKIINIFINCEYGGNRYTISCQNVCDFLKWYKETNQKSQGIILSNIVAKLSNIAVEYPYEDLPFR